MHLLESFKKTKIPLPSLPRWRDAVPRAVESPLALLEKARTHGAFVLRAGRERVAVLGSYQPDEHRLDLEGAFVFDRAFMSSTKGWRAVTLGSTSLTRRVHALLDDRLLRLQIERAAEAASAVLDSWGVEGQRALKSAVTEISAAVAVAAVAGATLDREARRALAEGVVTRQQSEAGSATLEARRPFAIELGSTLVDQLEGRAPRWMMRTATRTRADALSTLRRAINKGARRRRETAASAHESDLLRLLCENGERRRNATAAAEILFAVIEQVQRRIQHDCYRVLARIAAESELVEVLLEEQDWVFGDQGDLTYETLRPLQQLRASLRDERARGPLHLALLAPTTAPLRVGAEQLEGGALALVDAPLPAPLVEARLAEPLSMTLLSLLLQRHELLPSAKDALRFRRRDAT